MKQKLLALALVLLLVLPLAACGGKPTEAPGSDAETAQPPADPDAGAADSPESDGGVTLRVAASPTPHAEILEQCVPILAEQGITLVIKEYGDYKVPNTAVEEGSEDANYFQHQPYLDQFNLDEGTHLVSVAKIHYEPMGIYGGKTASLEALADGASVAVPNDVTNEARALQLLAAQGLIEIDPDAGLNATPNDITSNPKNLKFTELEAAMLPNTVEEFDLNVINSNYALQAGLNPATQALASEDSDSEAAQTFANVLVVKEGRENDAAIQALVDALTSDTIRQYIEDTYAGAVVPIF